MRTSRSVLLVLTYLAVTTLPLVIAVPPLSVGPEPAFAQSGSWQTLSSWPHGSKDLGPVHLVHLPNGKFLFWGTTKNAALQSLCWLFDTNNSNYTFSDSFPAPIDIFCAGHTGLADSTAYVVGGNQASACSLQPDGIVNTNLYRPIDKSWTAKANMGWKRWYPTATTLPDGRALTTGGIYCGPPANLVATTPEVYLPAQDQLSPLNDANMAPWHGSPFSSTYPHMFVLPNGEIAIVGPEADTRSLDPIPWTWDSLAVDTANRFRSSSVMYRPGLVLKTGGSPNGGCSIATADARTIDLTQATPSWSSTDAMDSARVFHNLTILPDGKVLATGGCVTCGEAYGPAPACTSTCSPPRYVLDAELFDPDAPAGQKWTTLAAMPFPGTYHTTAALMPDGKVLVARQNPCPDTGMVFTPPYLEGNPSRPSITQAPLETKYARNIAVTIESGHTLSKVTLLRLAAVTHGIDQGQRFYSCAFTQNGTQVTATAPPSPNHATPGYYMLFVVNTSGVPSVAKYIKLAIEPQVTPNSHTAEGDVQAGDLASLYQGDNNRLQIFNDSGVPVRLTIEGLGPYYNAELAYLKLRMEASTSKVIPVTVEMWDWTASAWVQVDSYSSTTSETARETNATDNPARFVRNTPPNYKVKARITWSGSQDRTVKVDESIWKFPVLGLTQAKTYPEPAIQEAGETAGRPVVFHLAPVAPNPGLGGARLSYELPRKVHVRLRVFDVTGRAIATLVDSRKPAGVHGITWDGRDERGRTVAAGTYVAVIEVGGFRERQKFVLIK